MIKAIIFDFDGVLAESADIKTRAFAMLFESEGPNAVKKVVGYHIRHTGVSRFDKFKYIYKKILKRPLSKKEYGFLCGNFSKIVMDEVIKAPYVKGAESFLKKFHRKYAFFIASATPQKEMRDIIKGRAMARYFKKIYGAPQKKEDIVKKAMKHCKASASEVVYIGDSLSDYNAAIANKVEFIARVGEAWTPFSGIGCVKVTDLRNLKSVLGQKNSRGELRS